MIGMKDAYAKFQEFYDKAGMKLLRRAVKLFYRIRPEGQSNIEEIVGKPAIVIANHQHSLDPFFIGSAAAYNGKHLRIRWLSKPQNFDNRYIGKLLEKLGAIKLESVIVDGAELRKTTKEANEEIRKTMEHGDCVGIFPQGKRKGGQFHSGAARYSLEYNVPVLPVVIPSELSKNGNLFGRIDVIFKKPVFPPEDILARYRSGDLEEKKRAAKEFSDLLREAYK